MRTEDAVLLHHNHSGMKIQSSATPEQNGNWVKATGRKAEHADPLQISISQSMYFYCFSCFAELEQKAYILANTSQL